ncbi:MAG: hypothetical protein IT567_01925 [Alphaproteobacteria bacterium]|nr:hypothetical protein [Alphaproteobacteria bacterium]
MTLASPLTSAAAALDGPTPLAIIRFNQERVYYDQALYHAVSRAVKVKSRVVFDVVAIVPVVGDPATDRRMQEASILKGNEVVASLRRMGIPAQRLSLASHRSNTAQSTEVHVFVR